jgi:surface polysaccharide O-acyltransferase-like enzyme
MESMSSSTARSVDALSLAKAIACFLVIVQHTCAYRFGSFHDGWMLVNIVDSLSRVAVPTFVMATGAIFLRRNEGFDYLFRRRLLRIALPLFFWSFFYMAWGAHSGQSYGNWPWRVLTGPPLVYHLWYFYAVVGLSLIMPVLSGWYGQSNIKDRWLAVATWFTMIALLPYLSFAGFSVPSLGYFPATGYAVLDLSGYLILGALLTTANPSRGRFWIGTIMYLGGAAATCALTYAAANHEGKPTEIFYYNNSAANIVASAGFFLAAQNVNKLPKLISGLVAVVAACSLGIYGLHPLVLDRLQSISSHLREPLADGLAIPLISIATFLIVFVSIFIARKVAPPLRSVM